MSCEQFEELAGAYAISALPQDEMLAAADHFASCSKHADVRELQLVAASLGTTAPEMEPPAALKSRLMEAIRADLAPQRSALLVVEPEGGLVARIAEWLRGPRLAYGLSGALAIAVAALLIWNISLQSDGGGGSDTLAADLGGAANGQITYVPSQRVAIMDLEDLDQLPAGQTYQAWLMRPGEAPVSLGTMEPSAERTARAVLTDVEFQDDDQIGITIEPSGGSAAPTSDPVVTGIL